MRLWERDALPGVVHLLLGVEVKGANGSTSCCALDFSGDTDSKSLLLYQLFCICFCASEGEGACCSTSCCTLALPSLEAEGD